MYGAMSTRPLNVSPQLRRPIFQILQMASQEYARSFPTIECHQKRMPSPVIESHRCLSDQKAWV